VITLGIDTATDRLAIGLADDEKIILEDSLDSEREHATRIMGLIDAVLERSEVTPDDLTGIAVADGPGSFTGLRIGMAVAKGMARALEIPIAGVSSFEVVARRLLEKYEIFFLTAVVRKGELYLCRVEKGTDIRSRIILIPGEKLAEKVGDSPVGLIGRAPEGWPESVINPIPSDLTLTSGGELALHGGRLLAAGRFSDLSEMEPFYIAPSQAERKFGRK